MVQRRTLATCAALMTLACLVQALLIWRATVPSLDTVWFVHLAQSLDRLGLAALLEHQERPVFPLWLWTVHRGLHALVGPFRAQWALSAQVAAAAAVVLAVVPVYFLSIRLVGQAAGLAGAVLFCVVREVCRLGADGISDSVHLFWLATALWAFVEYWTRRQTEPPSGLRRSGALLLSTAGVASAMALLTRLEAATVPAAFVVAMLAFQLQPARRQPYRRMVEHLGWFALGFALVYLAYVAALGSIHSPTVAGKTADSSLAKLSSQSPQSETSALAWRLPDGNPMSFAARDPSQSIRRRGYVAAAGQFLAGLGGTFGVWAGALALLGLWRLHTRQASMADRFLHVLLTIFSAAAFLYCAHEGYLLSRHMLLWVVVGIGCAGYGVIEAGKWLAELPLLHRTGFGRLAAPAALAITVLACAVQLVEPLHASRLGHRFAAEWLSLDADPSGKVLDTWGWTGLYSGHPTYLAEDLPTAWSDPRLAYVVVEQRELRLASTRSRTLCWLLQTAGQLVGAFPDAPQDDAATVLVYRWIPERLPWQTVTR